MAENEGGTSGLAWFLAGLGIGTLVGVLYAPKAGKETREDLANASREAKERAAELVEQGRQKANEYVETGRQYVEQGKQKAAELVEEGKKQAKDSVDKGREYYEKGRTQWSQYVEKGKGLATEQQAKVEAAVDAAKDAGLLIILVALALSGLGMGVSNPATSATMSNELAASEYGVASCA